MKKQRGKVILMQDKTFCGIDREQLFKQAIMPAL